MINNPLETIKFQGVPNFNRLTNRNFNLTVMLNEKSKDHHGYEDS